MREWFKLISPAVFASVVFLAACGPGETVTVDASSASSVASAKAQSLGANDNVGKESDRPGVVVDQDVPSAAIETAAIEAVPATGKTDLPATTMPATTTVEPQAKPLRLCSDGELRSVGGDPTAARVDGVDALILHVALQNVAGSRCTRPSKVEVEIRDSAGAEVITLGSISSCASDLKECLVLEAGETLSVDLTWDKTTFDWNDKTFARVPPGTYVAIVVAHAEQKVLDNLEPIGTEDPRLHSEYRSQFDITVAQ